jgi:hypothetical protein
LSAMLALTPNAPEFQPGFENVDTTVKGCAPLSASLDLVDVNNDSSEVRARIIKDIACREGSPESAESTSCPLSLFLAHASLHSFTNCVLYLLLDLKFLTDNSPIHLIKETGVPFFVLQ